MRKTFLANSNQVSRRKNHPSLPGEEHHLEPHPRMGVLHLRDRFLESSLEGQFPLLLQPLAPVMQSLDRQEAQLTRLGKVPYLRGTSFRMALIW